MVISPVVAAIGNAVNAGNETFTVTLPSAASSGTRTGPWNWLPQQRESSVNFATIAGASRFAAGNVISAIGLTSSGIWS